MLDYVYGQDGVVAQFVAQLIPHAGGSGFGPCKTIGVIDTYDGGLIAGLVYNGYDPDAGLIHITGAALPRAHWFTRETIKRMYQYPFLDIGVQMVVQRTPADNEQLLSQLARGGYMFVKVPRMFGRERDGVLALLTYEDWLAHPITKRFKHHIVDDAEKEAA